MRADEVKMPADVPPVCQAAVVGERLCNSEWIMPVSNHVHGGKPWEGGVQEKPDNAIHQAQSGDPIITAKLL